MPPLINIGTHDMNSLLAMTNTTALEIGFDTTAQILAEDLANFNTQVDEMLADFVETTQDRSRTYGASQDGAWYEADEYTRGPTQRATGGYPVGFPLKRFQTATGWTRDWIEAATGADIAQKQNTVKKGYVLKLRRDLATSVFNPTNYDFIDVFGKNVQTLKVKALINADSTAMQQGPNGEVFDGSTHTHYNANATLTAAAVQANIDDIVEHGFSSVVTYINQANATAFAALTGFSPLLDVRQFNIADTTTFPNGQLEVQKLDNKQIGLFGGGPVWIKPWVPANYAVSFDTSTPVKPLVRRIRHINPGVRTIATLGAHPLSAEYYEDHYGFGVWNRLAMAVLQFNNASYSAPTLTL